MIENDTTRGYRGFNVDNALLAGRKGEEWQAVIERNEMAIKALSMDYEAMIAEIEEKSDMIYKDKSKGTKFAWLDDVLEIIKKYLEVPE